MGLTRVSLTAYTCVGGLFACALCYLLWGYIFYENSCKYQGLWRCIFGYNDDFVKVLMVISFVCAVTGVSLLLLAVCMVLVRTLDYAIVLKQPPESVRAERLPAP